MTNPLIPLGNGQYVGTYPATIPPYTVVGGDDDDDGVITVDTTKYCWIGGLTEFQTIPRSEAVGEAFAVVNYGYAKDSSGSDPKIILSHAAKWSYTYNPMALTDLVHGDCQTTVSSGEINIGGELRICVDTHGHDDYSDTTSLRYKLSQDLNSYYTLDGDYGNVGQRGVYNGVITAGEITTRRFDLTIISSAVVSCSSMKSDAEIINLMNQGYVYPWVSCAYPTGSLTTSAYHKLHGSDEDEEWYVDWGWVTESASFNNIKVNVPRELRDTPTTQWKDVSQIKVHVNGEWKPVVQAHIRAPGVSANNWINITGQPQITLL